MIFFRNPYTDIPVGIFEISGSRPIQRSELFVSIVEMSFWRKFIELVMYSIVTMVGIKCLSYFSITEYSLFYSFSYLRIRETSYYWYIIFFACSGNSRYSLCSWEWLLGSSCHLLSVDEKYKSHYFSPIVFYIGDRISKCCSRRYDIIEDDAFFSRDTHPESTSCVTSMSF